MSDKGGCNQVIASDKTEEEKQIGVLGEMEGRGGNSGCRRPSGLQEDETVGYQMLLEGEHRRRISLTLGNFLESALNGI